MLFAMLMSYVDKKVLLQTDVEARLLSALLQTTSEARRLLALFQSVVEARRLLALFQTAAEARRLLVLLQTSVESPTTTHWSAIKRILRYLRHTPHHGLLIRPSSSLNISALSDSDWAGCPDDRCSTTDYCIFLGDNLIFWNSKKQQVVARSSIESEYRDLAHATAELIWLQSLLRYGLYSFVTGTNSAPEAFLQVEDADGSSVLTPDPTFTN
ncbi:uncharacterized mitochondrial protein AtMg00810-like [Impatiens glandulifera]|uniref:uncharacterized mitochondrial protein AtMg00810-like n=1 Tax=Impatiens glandulifera TaxID=253017 RepID=UPI001FB18EC1|nr:uncharacterized mitochondrial protein AtMg00810-like [Impatiens glandulifera]